jgi:hypothetical protein
VQQVRQLEVIFRREKGALETEDLERSEEMDRLRPLVERLNELQAVFDSSGVPNYEKVEERPVVLAGYLGSLGVCARALETWLSLGLSLYLLYFFC